jgi:hypothetical protein
MSISSSNSRSATGPRWLAYLAFASGGALIGAFHVASSGKAPSQVESRYPTTSLAREADDRSLVALQRRVAQLEQSQHAAPPAPAAAERAAAALPSGDERPSSEELEEQSEAFSESFVQAFERETRDPRWAEASERELGDRFEEGGISVTPFECGQTLCRASVTSSEADLNLQVAMLSAGNKLAKFSSVRVQRDQDGGPLVVYAVRLGSSVPPIL